MWENNHIPVPAIKAKLLHSVNKTGSLEKARKDINAQLVATVTAIVNCKMRGEKTTSVLSKQPLQVRVLTCPLWLDGLLAQSQSFVRDRESSSPSNELCVDCCCLACCPSLTRSQNDSRTGRLRGKHRNTRRMSAKNRVKLPL